MLIEQLKLIKSGKAIEHPVYSFVKHTRESYSVRVEPKPIILIEGILIFENKKLADLMDIKIFVDTDADIRFIRRLIRDVNERGRTIDSVINQYCNTVKPMHEQFVEYSKKNADLIVPKGGNNAVALNMIREQIRNIIGRGQSTVKYKKSAESVNRKILNEDKLVLNKLNGKTEDIINDV